MAKTTRSAKDLFLMSLRDIYDAEKQILKALPKMVSAAEGPELRDAFEDHISETEQQVQRLETIFAELGEAARPKRCEAIRALIREGDRHIREFADTEAGDAALASAGQAVEHYEISQYTSLKRLAQQLGMTEAAEKLDETLQEEIATKDLLDELGAMGAEEAGTLQTAEATNRPNQMPRGLRAGGIQPRVSQMARDSNVRERDEQGRFMSDDDDDRRMSRGRSRYEDDDDRRGSSRSRSRDDDDDRRSSSRSRSRDDDNGRGQGRGGWFGDSEGHSEASRRGWENRDDDRSSRSRSRDDDDDRRSYRSRSDDNRGRGQGGWFGDSEGHSEASRRGWENRDDDRRSSSGRSRYEDDDRRSSSRSRSRDDDDDRRSSSRSRSRDDDDDRRGRRTGGWFGDSEGHSEAAQKAWDRGREPGGWFGDSEGHSEASRRAWERGREPGGWFGDSEGHSEASRRGWERGREPGGWFGDSEGHSEASRRGWENRDDDRRSSRRSYRD